MSTCRECGWWSNDGEAAKVQVVFPVGFCLNGDAFPKQMSDYRPRTWGDFSCPHFKQRQDWAEKAAKRIGDHVQMSVWEPIDIAQIIREEAAKAGVK